MRPLSAEARSEVRDKVEALGTALICDVFDEQGWGIYALNVRIRRRTAPLAKLAGWAYTFKGAHDLEPGPDLLKLKAVDEITEDSVAVWAGTDARGICLFGDLLAGTMANRGCRGAVVDGGFRDNELVSELGFPVFAKYTSPVQSVGRWRLAGYNVPICLPGACAGLVPVEPGDFVLGDEDGVVVIPQDRMEPVLERAEQILRDEAEARTLGADGLTAQEMLDRFGHV